MLILAYAICTFYFYDSSGITHSNTVKLNGVVDSGLIVGPSCGATYRPLSAFNVIVPRFLASERSLLAVVYLNSN